MMSRELGRVPTIHDIDMFRKDGKTEISGAAFAYRFGQRSFVKAREELERIIKEGY